MKRMQAKERSHKSTAPHGSRHLPQHQEEQQSLRRMKNDIGNMVGARLCSEELAVQHVGYPRQRVPVRRVKSFEGPTQPFPCQPALYHRVAAYIIRVIKFNE